MMELHEQTHPYLREAAEAGYRDWGVFEARRRLVRKYAWAMLSQEAIEGFAAHSPILAVGSGNGYNESLIKEAGADIIATDLDPWQGRTYMDVWKRGASEAAAQYSQRALMFCWPSYAESWAWEALCAYRGNTVLYVGEGAGGCTGCDRFHNLLSGGWSEDYEAFIPGDWEEVQNFWIPQWNGIHDFAAVYRRKVPLP